MSEISDFARSLKNRLDEHTYVLLSNIYKSSMTPGTYRPSSGTPGTPGFTHAHSTPGSSQNWNEVTPTANRGELLANALVQAGFGKPTVSLPKSCKVIVKKVSRSREQASITLTVQGHVIVVKNEDIPDDVEQVTHAQHEPWSLSHHVFCPAEQPRIIGPLDGIVSHNGKRKKVSGSIVFTFGPLMDTLSEDAHRQFCSMWERVFEEKCPL